MQLLNLKGSSPNTYEAPVSQQALNSYTDSNRSQYWSHPALQVICLSIQGQALP